MHNDYNMCFMFVIAVLGAEVQSSTKSADNNVESLSETKISISNKQQRCMNTMVDCLDFCPPELFSYCSGGYCHCVG